MSVVFADLVGFTTLSGAVSRRASSRSRSSLRELEPVEPRFACAPQLEAHAPICTFASYRG